MQIAKGKLKNAKSKQNSESRIQKGWGYWILTPGYLNFKICTLQFSFCSCRSGGEILLDSAPKLHIR